MLTQICHLNRTTKETLGDYLGDMKDEVPNNKILSFVTVDQKIMRIPTKTKMKCSIRVEN